MSRPIREFSLRESGHLAKEGCLTRDTRDGGLLSKLGKIKTGEEDLRSARGFGQEYAKVNFPRRIAVRFAEILAK